MSAGLWGSLHCGIHCLQILLGINIGLCGHRLYSIVFSLKTLSNVIVKENICVIWYFSGHFKLIIHLRKNLGKCRLIRS